MIIIFSAHMPLKKKLIAIIKKGLRCRRLEDLNNQTVKNMEDIFIE
jgi:hypothetical protein